LLQRLSSQGAGDFVSESHELVDAVRRVCEATERQGICLIGGGGDRRALYREFLKEASPLRFIIRQRGDRHLLYRKKSRQTMELAESLRAPYCQKVIKEK